MKNEKEKKKILRHPSSQNCKDIINYIRPNFQCEKTNELEEIKETKLGDYLETSLSDNDISDDLSSGFSDTNAAIKLPLHLRNQTSNTQKFFYFCLTKNVMLRHKSKQWHKFIYSIRMDKKSNWRQKNQK